MTLHNRYFIMRHGESEANRAGLIVSDPCIGVEGYGLTGLGRKQVRASLEGYTGPPVSCIFSSDFARARETALLAAGFFGLETPVLTDLLRERFFGDYDGRGDDRYGEIWELDAISPEEYPGRIESPASVRSRALKLLGDCERRFSGRVILYVSHGDTLQILMAVLAGLPAEHHRSLPHLEKAEIRELIPADDFIPEEAP